MVCFDHKRVICEDCSKNQIHKGHMVTKYDDTVLMLKSKINEIENFISEMDVYDEVFENYRKI